MNENIDLCKLLKGHEGETFYSPIFGDVVFHDIYESGEGHSKHYFIRAAVGSILKAFYPDGKYTLQGESMLFPSKDQRDWNRWAEEQKPKTPKVWGEIKECNVETLYALKAFNYKVEEPIVKSAIALLKIHQLIEVGYGGNITSDEWKDFSVEKFIIVPHEKGFKVDHRFKLRAFRHIAFHTMAQANEFLSYPNNKLLLKDFYNM